MPLWPGPRTGDSRASGDTLHADGAPRWCGHRGTPISRQTRGLREVPQKRGAPETHTGKTAADPVHTVHTRACWSVPGPVGSACSPICRTVRSTKHRCWGIGSHNPVATMLLYSEAT